MPYPAALFYLFLSTPSARRATFSTSVLLFASKKFLSTPSARRATKWFANVIKSYKISIHALREEGDPAPFRGGSVNLYFYPRPPRGGRPKQKALDEYAEQFLSTPSARRATNVDHEIIVDGLGISIHALREEGDRPLVFPSSQCVNISIHALREEGDVLSTVLLSLSVTFLSTPSARRATEYQRNYCHRGRISIHALREEGDPIMLRLNCRCGIFLSTPSARRATQADYSQV